MSCILNELFKDILLLCKCILLLVVVVVFVVVVEAVVVVVAVVVVFVAVVVVVGGGVVLTYIRCHMNKNVLYTFYKQVRGIAFFFLKGYII